MFNKHTPHIIIHHKYVIHRQVLQKDDWTIHCQVLLKWWSTARSDTPPQSTAEWTITAKCRRTENPRQLMDNLWRMDYWLPNTAEWTMHHRMQKIHNQALQNGQSPQNRKSTAVNGQSLKNGLLTAKHSRMDDAPQNADNSQPSTAEWTIHR